jgi:hypothetical protein
LLEVIPAKETSNLSKTLQANQSFAVNKTELKKTSEARLRTSGGGEQREGKDGSVVS